MDIEDIAPVSGEANAAAVSERARISAILESVEAKRNPEMAQEFALRTPLSADQAKALLAKAPAANPYLAAMAKEGPVGIEANAPNFTEGDAMEARKEEIRLNAIAFNNERRKTQGLPLLPKDWDNTRR